MEHYILIIGLLAASVTTIAFIPQTAKTIRTKHTKDLSLPMVILLELGLILWLLYGILILSLPIILTNALNLIMLTIILIYKLKYS